VNGAMENHYRMMKQMKGVPGVLEERYQEAFKIRHCALSLVGEPIMYPYINEFVDLLHKHEISSFLVTNAQVCGPHFSSSFFFASKAREAKKKKGINLLCLSTPLVSREDCRIEASDSVVCVC